MSGISGARCFGCGSRFAASALPGHMIRCEQVDNEWMERARCRGMNPDLFFPQRGESSKEAKAVCAGCDVRSECLEYALASGERHGIMGGTSEKERRRIRSARARGIAV